MTVTLPADLRRSVDQGDSAATAALLTAMTPAQRQALLPAFKAILRAGGLWQEVGPLLVAGAATLSTAAQVAAWIGRSQLLSFAGSYEPVLSVLATRDDAWLGELGTRLAEGLRSDGLGHWHLAATLIGLSGAPVPTNDAFVRRWARHALRGGVEPPSPSRLRSDPLLPALLPRVFEVDGLGLLIPRWDWRQRGDSSAYSAFAGALVVLSDEGTVRRAMLLEGVVGRLLRGDSVAALRPFVELHRQLRPNLGELTAHQIDYLRLLPDSPSFVASMAQAALRTLDAAGQLPSDALAEASEAVLSRPEKALVRAQLTWLAGIVTRDPARAADVVPLLGLARNHPDLALAQQAQALADKWGGAAMPTRPAAVAPPEPLLLPAGPADVEPPIRTTAELAADIVALLDGTPPDAAAWERVLDGIVRRWAEDPPSAIADALAPIAARQHDGLRTPPGPAAGPAAHLRHAIIRLLDPAPRPIDPVRVPAGHGLGRILTARINELSLELRRRPVPFLLATPTSVSGRLRPDTLVERMIELEQRGAQPWPYDLDQALLRLPREIDPNVVQRSSRLASPAGQRLARWLTCNGMSDPTTARVVIERQYEQWKKPAQLTVALVEIGPAVQPDNVIAAAACGCQPRTSRHRWYPDRDIWPAVLPSHPEVVAAHLLPAIADAAQLDLNSCPPLTFLADGTGPAGPATALALVYGLAAKAADARTSAVDTILQLATRDNRCAAAVGGEIGALGSTGALKLNRITTSVDDVIRAGGSAVAWDLIHPALPALLTTHTPPRGAGDFLQLAARVAAQLGIRSTVHGLDAVVTRTGSSQYLTEARRLQRVLTTGAL